MVNVKLGNEMAKCNVHHVTSVHGTKKTICREALTGTEPMSFCTPVGYSNH